MRELGGELDAAEHGERVREVGGEQGEEGFRGRVGVAYDDLGRW